MRSLALGILLLAGCAVTSGRQIRQEQLGRIALGMTTWAEAVAILGPPNHVMDSYNSTSSGYYGPQCGEEKANIRVAQYQYYAAHVGGGGNHASTELLIDHRGVVCSIKRGGGSF